MSEKPAVGTIGWIDLTVPEATKLRDFYCNVVGWEAGGVDMGGYEDFNMSPPGGDAVAGVCHARAGNADLPPAWLIYITVADLDESIARCESGGGAVVAGPKKMGAARYCIIRDPAGAHCALFQY